MCCTDSFAGVERHISELALAQAESGTHTVIIGGDQGRLKAAVRGEVEVLPGHRIDVAIGSLRRLPLRPTVVNVHMTAAEVAVALTASMRGVPVVSTRHFASARGSRRASRPLTRWSGRRIDAQISVSQYVADHVDGSSIVVLSGVQPDPGRVPAAVRTPVVLMAQRLEREKRTDLGFRAFAMSGLANSGWRLAVAGGGSLREDLERLAAALGIARQVDFLGHRSDVHDLMRTAGVFLATRPDEAFGLSVVEAMARGLPVVAAGSGAHLETVGSVQDAAFFDPSSSPDAGRVLAALALDEERRERYGAALQAAQRERFTVKLQARHTDVAYRSVL